MNILPKTSTYRFKSSEILVLLKAILYYRSTIESDDPENETLNNIVNKFNLDKGENE